MTENNTPQRRHRARTAVFVCIVLITLGIDQLTKYLALSHLADGRTVEVIPRLLQFTLVRNPGASLGMGSNMTWLISLLAVVACIVLGVLAWRTTSMLWNICLALAFSGALGNLIDRVIYADGFLNGRVVDFLNYGWSVGNIADVFLAIAGVGIVLLVLCNIPFHADSSTSQSQGDDHA